MRYLTPSYDTRSPSSRCSSLQDTTIEFWSTQACHGTQIHIGATISDFSNNLSYLRVATHASSFPNDETIANIFKKVDGYAEADEGREPNRRRIFNSYAAFGKLENHRSWNEEHPQRPQFDVRDDSVARRNEHRDTGSWEPALTASGFLRGHPFITSTIHSIKKYFNDSDVFRYDYPVMDEASPCAPDSRRGLGLALVARAVDH